MIVVLATWGSAVAPGLGFAEAVFPAFMLLALLRILPRLMPDRWAGWFNDRALIALLLATAMLAGVERDAIQLVAGLLALSGIILPFGQSRLTRH